MGWVVWLGCAGWLMRLIKVEEDENQFFVPNSLGVPVPPKPERTTSLRSPAESTERTTSLTRNLMGVGVDESTETSTAKGTQAQGAEYGLVPTTEPGAVAASGQGEQRL